jgi:hypothetical protein
MTIFLRLSVTGKSARFKKSAGSIILKISYKIWQDRILINLFSLDIPNKITFIEFLFSFVIIKTISVLKNIIY